MLSGVATVAAFASPPSRAYPHRTPPRAHASGASSSAASREAPTMILLGLTGSIAMGKSFVAGVLTKMGIPVLDSDAVVHDLYAPGGAAVEPVRALFGASVVAEDGGISRAALGAFVLGPENEANMRALEAAVHPLVDDARWAFIDAAEADAHPLVVIDIPLLYEKGYEDTVDAVMVASTGDADEQRARALARRA